MERLIIKQTEDTPAIILIPEEKVFQIVGHSLPEDASSFYRIIFDWFDKFFAEDPKLDEIVLDLRLFYFNTPSIRQIVALMNYLYKKREKYNIRIEWKYQEEDDDMKAIAYRYKKILGFDDSFLTIKSVKTIPSILFNDMKKMK